MDAEGHMRKIIHVDMDAFFASVEQRDDPSLLGKPVAVGGSSKRGVVAAASYESRVFGVRSAMPSVTAKRLCPELIFVRPRFEVYRDVSYQIREIFFQYTDLVEPLSLDEAYLDVSVNKKHISSASRIAKDIQHQIKAETHLTASAGISINKFLAKVASGIHKPNGLTLIPPDAVDAFIEKLPIGKFYGIGKKTAEKMKRLGIHNGKDLKAREEAFLAQHFGKVGRHFYRIVRGLDDRPVKPNRIRKSVGAENTFRDDLQTEEEMLKALHNIIQRVSERIQRVSTAGKTVTLKIKYHDFQITTRSKTLDHYIDSPDEILSIIKHLLYKPEFPVAPVRLLGVSLSNLSHEQEAAAANPYGYQLSFEF